MMKLFKNEDAFTGLEAAIVLIAFIVVAAVFSYVMLNAGFFATQEAQRVVHTGSQQASSSLEIIGNVYGRTNNTTDSTNPGCLEWIEFTVGNTAGGTPIDINQMLVTFVSGENTAVIPFNASASIKGIINGTDEIGGESSESDARAAILKAADTSDSKGAWGVIMTYNDVGVNVTNSTANRNNLLEPGEQFVLMVAFPREEENGPTVLTPNTRFSVNLQPAIGSAYPIKKTVPSSIYEVNIL